MTHFTEDYYKSGSYTNYLEREDRYLNMADEIVRCLRGVCVIDRDQPIIDYGCGPGLFVTGLQRAGCQRVFGIDISEWALAECAKRGVQAYAPFTPPESRYYFTHLMFCLDVLEHMTPDTVGDPLTRFQPEYLVVRIPVTREVGGRYILETSESDPTHVIRWPKESWYDFFKQCGYEKLFRFGLYTIYDTPGVLAALLKRVTDTPE